MGCKEACTREHAWWVVMWEDPELGTQSTLFDLQGLHFTETTARQLAEKLYRDNPARAVWVMNARMAASWGPKDMRPAPPPAPDERKEQRDRAP